MTRSDAKPPLKYCTLPTVKLTHIQTFHAPSAPGDVNLGKLSAIVCSRARPRLDGAGETVHYSAPQFNGALSHQIKQTALTQAEFALEFVLFRLNASGVKALTSFYYCSTFFFRDLVLNTAWTCCVRKT